MAKIAFIADVHIGNHLRFGGPISCSKNSRCRMALSCLERARSLVNDCDALVIAGDLFDHHRPEAPVIAGVQEILSRSSGLQTYIMRGNHDQNSDEPGDHALAPLEIPPVSVVDEPHTQHFGANDGISVMLLPYRSGESSRWIPEAVEDYADWADKHYADWKYAMTRVLVLHAGIITPGTPPYLQNAHDAISVEQLDAIAKRHGLSYVLAGNWHGRMRMEREWGQHRCTYLQIGALVPTGFDNPGLAQYGTVAIVATDGDGNHSLEIREVPGPRFVKVQNADELKAMAQAARGAGHNLMVEWSVERDEAGHASAVADVLKSQSLLYDAEIVSSRPQTPEAVALPDKSPDAVDRAVARFIDDMPVPDDVDRNEVLNRVRQYLAQAQESQ